MPNYKHFLNMTDQAGILQFSVGSQPARLSGYTLDDNARALIVSIYMENGYEYARIFSSNLYSAQQNDGNWSNFFLDRRYYAHQDSEDSIGRALLACSIGSLCQWPDIKYFCQSMFDANLSKALFFSSPRAMAYTLLAICKRRNNNQYSINMAASLAEQLAGFYKKNQRHNWAWFENYITYCNGILPQSLLAYYNYSKNATFLKIGREALDFLNKVLFKSGYLNIIGNQGWYQKDFDPPMFDQQPVDAASVIFACYEAYLATGHSEYAELVKVAHRWYHGQNIHGISMLDENTGGCYDALTAKGVNLNQGSEAVISLLLSDMLIEGLIKPSSGAVEDAETPAINQ